jgi:hypothetical protein
MSRGPGSSVLWRTLNGHEAGNGGYCQGDAPTGGVQPKWRPGGQGVGREAESEGHEEKLRAVIKGATPRMNRSAEAGARSSLHYGGEGVLTHPAYQGVCGRNCGRKGTGRRRSDGSTFRRRARRGSCDRLAFPPFVTAFANRHWPNGWRPSSSQILTRAAMGTALGGHLTMRCARSGRKSRPEGCGSWTRT